nr:hypothetical protein [uncultured Caldimonas sp.]
MKRPSLTLLASLLIAPLLAAAQPGGPGPGRGPGPRWGHGFTSGWSMMTPAERDQHRDRVQSFKSYEECRAYMDEHHQQMLERARNQNLPMPGRPMHDGCQGLPSASQK